jgi:hypothetical protein
MPLPHVWPETVTTLRLLEKQVALTLFLWKAEQMLPTEQGENRLMPWAVEGFMMKSSPASQVPELNGQHCWAFTRFWS